MLTDVYVESVVLFLSLKQRYRLIRVFGNTSVNNGQGSSDRCSVDPSSLACFSLSLSDRPAHAMLLHRTRTFTGRKLLNQVAD